MVLIVDDDQKITDLLRDSLTRHGHSVETACDGVEAFKYLKSPDCKCMLLDMQMPRINGAELLILMESEDVKVPTIVMAGFSEFNEEELKGFDNVVKFLSKPFELEDMLEAVDTYSRP